MGRKTRAATLHRGQVLYRVNERGDLGPIGPLDQREIQNTDWLVSVPTPEHGFLYVAIAKWACHGEELSKEEAKLRVTELLESNYAVWEGHEEPDMADLWAIPMMEE